MTDKTKHAPGFALFSEAIHLPAVIISRQSQKVYMNKIKQMSQGNHYTIICILFNEFNMFFGVIIKPYNCTKDFIKLDY